MSLLITCLLGLIWLGSPFCRHRPLPQEYFFEKRCRLLLRPPVSHLQNSPVAIFWKKYEPNPMRMETALHGWRIVKTEFVIYRFRVCPSACALVLRKSGGRPFLGVTSRWYLECFTRVVRGGGEGAYWRLRCMTRKAMQSLSLSL